jgi:hypothetical protein
VDNGTVVSGVSLIALPVDVSREPVVETGVDPVAVPVVDAVDTGT